MLHAATLQQLHNLHGEDQTWAFKRSGHGWNHSKWRHANNRRADAWHLLAGRQSQGVCYGVIKVGGEHAPSSPQQHFATVFPTSQTFSQDILHYTVHSCSVILSSSNFNPMKFGLAENLVASTLLSIFCICACEAAWKIQKGNNKRTVENWIVFLCLKFGWFLG